ncbi:N-(5'-phosphoribosyl)anthranilate isomerase [Clostridia bacterium]|nr:N-(5'-phosphoribosyl)anthranilate isomerase [Clostridia bacterium]
MGIKVKICGLTREIDIAAINHTLPDYAGFVFAPVSKRYISPLCAGELIKKLDERIISVAVLKDCDVDEAVSAVRQSGVRAVQLHGNQDNEYIRRLKAEVNIPVIKAFTAPDSDTLKEIQNSEADYILLDGLIPGSGRQWDYDMLIGLPNEILSRTFIAGGINASNVINPAKFHPYAFDVSTGVEKDGVKDAGMIEQFVNTIRGL